MFLFYQIYKNSSNLDKKQINFEYGFLYNSYKKEHYYWEFVKILQKTVIFVFLCIYN